MTRSRLRAELARALGGPEPAAREVPDGGRDGSTAPSGRAVQVDVATRADGDLRDARSAARREARDLARRPRAPRLHDQRDGDLAAAGGPRRHVRLLRRIRGPRGSGPCACCTTAASSRTRRACCARCATRRASASAWMTKPSLLARGCADAGAAGRPCLDTGPRRAARPAGRKPGGARPCSAWPSWASTGRCTRRRTPRPGPCTPRPRTARCRGRWQPRAAARAAGLPVRGDDGT